MNATRTLLAVMAMAAGVAGCGRSEAPQPAPVKPPRLRPFRNLIPYAPPVRLTAGIRQLRGLALGPEGKLYCAGADGIGVFTLAGRRLACWPTRSPAHAVAAVGDRVYVGLRDKVQVLDARGKRVAEWGKPGSAPGEFGFITAIALHESNVYVADAANRRIHRYDTTGDFINEIGEREGDGGLILPGMSLDLFVDAAGVLHVGNTGRLRVEQYLPNGALRGHWGRPGLDAEGFCGCCNPIHLAGMPDGGTVTVEKGLPRIKVHSAEGKLLAVLGEELVRDDVKDIDQSPQPGKAGAGATALRYFLGDVVADANETIYVASPRMGAIYAFHPKHVRETGKHGTEQQQ